MATQITRTQGLLGFLAMLTLGCSDASDGGGSLSTREFIQAAALAECDDFGDCCAQDEHPFDEQRCRARVRSVLEALADNDAVVYDADAAGGCVRAFRASPGQCETMADEFQSCGAVFRGTKPLGAPCAAPQECLGFADGDVFCWQPAGSELDVCARVDRPLAPVGEGEACGWTCDLDGGCTSFGSGLPGTCLISDGLYCAQATDTCTLLVAAGGSCAGETLACPVDTFCDGERCTQLRQLGEACPTRTGCVAGAFCDDGLCTALRGENEGCGLRYGGCDELTCLSPDHAACQAGLYCSTRDGLPKCIAPQPDGAACTSFQECSSSWCETGSCSGDDCSASGVCTEPKRTTSEFCAGDFSDEDAASVQSALPNAVRVAGPSGALPARRPPWQQAHRLN